MSRSNTWILFMLYLCFCFPVFTKWHDCSLGSHTHRSTQGHQRQMKPDSRHSPASFPELITEGRSFLCSVLSVVSLCHFLFSSSPLHVPSELLIFYLASIFFPLRFFCAFFSKGEHSLEVNHAPQTQTIYSCAGDLFFFSFWIPLFFCRNFCFE